LYKTIYVRMIVSKKDYQGYAFMDINQKNFLYTITKIRQKLFAFLEGELLKNKIQDLAPSYGDILYIIDIHGPLTLQEIARFASKDKSTVSSVIRKLEESGYVTKVKEKDDARFVRIALTAKAKKIKTILMRISSNMNERIFNGLSQDEINNLFSILNKIYKNI